MRVTYDRRTDTMTVVLRDAPIAEAMRIRRASSSTMTRTVIWYRWKSSMRRAD